MKTTIIHLSLAVLAGSIATAREPKEPRGHRPPPIIAALDADRDGVISAEEIANAANALLQLDKNGDGQLTPDEFHPEGRPPRGGGRPPGGPPEEPQPAE
jgi:EF hand